jgi:hypothetical protein
MRIGFGVFLFTVGAILRFAANWHISGLNVHTTGTILMFVGIVWAGISVALYRSQRHGSVVTRRRQLGNDPEQPGQVVYEETQSVDNPTDPTAPVHRPGIYDEVTHPGKAVTYPRPEVLEDPPSPYNNY